MAAKLTAVLSIVTITLLWAGCDVGINPILFDGAPLVAAFRVDAAGSAYDESETVDLADLRSGIDKNIDSVKVINITLQIDSTAGTNPSTTVHGAALIDGDTLFVVNGVPISEFAAERSIFDSTITGGPIFDSAGVTHLIALVDDLRTGTGQTVVTMRAFGTTSTSNLHFTITLRLYTQVFTPKPSK